MLNSETAQIAISTFRTLSIFSSSVRVHHAHLLAGQFHVNAHNKHTMISIFKAPISTSTKITLVLFALVGTINLIDFIFYAQEPRKIISAIGYTLMSYGIYKNSLAKEPLGRGALYGFVVGFVMVAAALAMRYLP